MKTSHCVSSFLLVLSMCLLAGCASVSVRDARRSSSVEPVAKPSIIRVVDFETTNAEFNVDRQGDELRSFKNQTSTALTTLLLKQIQEKIGPAAEQSTPLGDLQEGWLVRGRFIRVNQGSRALRMTIGFGTGGTKMETQVWIYDLSRSRTQPFLTFQTSGGSGSEPGAVVGTGAVDAAVSAATGSLGGVGDDCQRTAKTIATKLSAYLTERSLK
jgi:hypothetical protein